MPAIRPFRCFDARLLGITLVAAGAIVAAAWFGRGFERGSLPRLTLGATQALALAWIVIAMVRSVATLDELERRIHAEALGGAGAFLVVVVAGWGFLEKAGLPAIPWADWIFPLLTLAWVTGVRLVSRKYR